MGAGGTIIGAIVVLGAVFYQFVLKDFLFLLGITRKVQSFEEFPAYKCRRITHDLLEGCEDMWLDHKDRKLYAACSEMTNRHAWCPATNALNLSSRAGTDHISVLNIDEPGADGLFRLRALEVTGGYRGTTGKELDLHGIDVEIISGGRLRFWMVNHRPPFDYISGVEIDPTKYGANSTVEVFEHTIGSSNLEFVKTISDPAISTPNDLAATGNGGFLLTNDHSGKVGFRREIGLLVGGGSIVHHSPTGKSQLITPQPDPSMKFPTNKLYLPNGILRGKDGLFYMADSASGKISVYTLAPAQIDSESGIPNLRQIDSINMKYPLDNLSVDSEGTIWSVGFPIASHLRKVGSSPPGTVNVATVVSSIKKVGEGKGNNGWKDGYLVEKTFEDGEGKVLAGLTVAVHDVASERIFVGGIMAGYLGVCEKQSL